MVENEIGIPGQIKLTNVSFTYQKGARPALVDINLVIDQGEMVALIGHSGSGKSTLAQIISGIIYQDEGIMDIGGVRLSKKGTFRQVGMVFQYPEQQLFGETVFEDVAFGAKNFGAAQMDLPGLVTAALIMVGLEPHAFIQRQPFALSGGEKRRGGISGGMVTGPGVFVFFET
ncbi:MAG: energy-coupling factor ABC transporter ATP-binding protein, partial [Clostridiales bacterium]|nr:energy-coupling factor ABC transporter ATP-binding protein [Clostridiales bacterium]